MGASPAGWYPQPDGRQRYWDGDRWTDHFAPATGEQPVLGAGATTAPQRKPARPWFRKKRVLIPAGFVVVMAIASAASGGGDDTQPVSAGVKPSPATSSAHASPSTPASSSSPSVATPSVDAAAQAKAAAAAKAKAAAEAKAKAAADAKAKAAAANAPYDETYGSFKAIVKKGRGDATIKLPTSASAGLVTFTHRGSSNVAVTVLDSSNQSTGDLLVNDIGNYSGTTAYGLVGLGGDPVKIKITADGSWTIRISPIASAPTLRSSAKGTGDKVFRYDGASADLSITHKGSANFVVDQFGGIMPNLAVNEIGSYRGVIPFTAGPTVVTIIADGSWTLRKQ